MDFKITITESAKNHLKKMITGNVAIAMSIKNTGCSGFQYIIDIVNSSETTFNKKPVSLYSFEDIPFLISAEDIKYLNNLNIDYVKDGLNSRIIYNNPQASHLCGCGTSFSLESI